MKNQKAPIIILQGSKQPYLSLGIHYGGVKVFGYEYYYLPNEDAFLRIDYLKKYNKHKKIGQNWETFVGFVKSEK